MKKTFLAKRNTLLSSRNVSWGVWALAFSFLVLLTRFFAPTFFWYVFTPVFKTSDMLGGVSHMFISSFGDASKLAALNEKVTSENTALASENQALLQKVANLSGLLGTAPAAGPGILAGVVAHPPESPYDTLVLAAGAQEGVLLGMEAFGAGGVPIGVVSSVLQHFSRVTLFSAPGMVTSGWVGHASLPLTITGAGGGAMQASIARSAAIAPGDVVFVPGPGMLPIGSVVRIDSDPLSPGVTVRIMPAINLFTVAWVELRATGVIPTAFATSTVP